MKSKTPRYFAFALLVFAFALGGCGSPNDDAGLKGGAAGGTGRGGTGGISSGTGGGGGAHEDAAPSTGGTTSVEHPELDAFILQKLKEAHKPGLSAAVVREGVVVWSHAYGEADIVHHQPVTAATRFETASVVKTITCATVLEMWEQGKLDLDDDVSTLLPFQVRNPAAPNTPITVRQLLTHTSSIRDSGIAYTLSVADVDSPIPLADFAQGYFSPGGQYYDATANFHAEYAPGAEYDYSNMAVTLAAYVVQVVSGVPFDQYVESHIFGPLGMTASTFHSADLNGVDAVPYTWNGSALDAVPRWGYPDWPSGHLYTTAGELGHFLAAFSRGGQYQNVRVLQESSVKEASRAQFPAPYPGYPWPDDQGLIWYYVENDAKLGHDGSDEGWASQMFFRVSDGIGVVLLLNGDRAEDSDADIINEIEARLMADGPSL